MLNKREGGNRRFVVVVVVVVGCGCGGDGGANSATIVAFFLNGLLFTGASTLV